MILVFEHMTIWSQPPASFPPERAMRWRWFGSFPNIGLARLYCENESRRRPGLVLALCMPPEGGTYYYYRGDLIRTFDLVKGVLYGALSGDLPAARRMK